MTRGGPRAGAGRKPSKIQKVPIGMELPRLDKLRLQNAASRSGLPYWRILMIGVEAVENGVGISGDPSAD